MDVECIRAACGRCCFKYYYYQCGLLYCVFTIYYILYVKLYTRLYVVQISLFDKIVGLYSCSQPSHTILISFPALCQGCHLWNVWVCTRVYVCICISAPLYNRKRSHKDIHTHIWWMNSHSCRHLLSLNKYYRICDDDDNGVVEVYFWNMFNNIARSIYNTYIIYIIYVIIAHIHIFTYAIEIIATSCFTYNNCGCIVWASSEKLYPSNIIWLINIFFLIYILLAI